jgi:hypothetical protein
MGQRKCSGVEGPRITERVFRHIDARRRHAGAADAVAVLAANRVARTPKRCTLYE